MKSTLRRKVDSQARYFVENQANFIKSNLRQKV